MGNRVNLHEMVERAYNDGPTCDFMKLIEWRGLSVIEEILTKEYYCCGFEVRVSRGGRIMISNNGMCWPEVTIDEAFEIGEMITRAARQAKEWADSKISE